MKKILIFSHYFRPYNLVGSKRVSFFNDFLNENGFSTYVIKASDKYYGNSISNANSKTDNIIPITPDAKLSKFSKPLAWCVKYFLEGIKISKTENIDLVYISGGPFFYFMAGLLIHLKLNIPYILDLRDPWFRSDYQGFTLKEKIINWGNYIFEKIVFRHATLIINVTDSLTSECKKRNPGIDKRKFITILNGYEDINDSDLLLPISELSFPGIKLAIFGKFSYYNSDHVDILIKSIKDINDAIEGSVSLYCLGSENEFLLKSEEFGIVNNVKYLGNFEYVKGMQKLRMMDALILNNRSDKNLGTKIFDYIYLNKPIIAFSSKTSEIKKILDNFENAHIVENSNDLAAAIYKIANLEKKELGSYEIREFYSRRYQFQILLKTMNSIDLNKD